MDDDIPKVRSYQAVGRARRSSPGSFQDADAPDIGTEGRDRRSSTFNGLK
jgi:hypothetical protein